MTVLPNQMRSLYTNCQLVNNRPGDGFKLQYNCENAQKANQLADEIRRIVDGLPNHGGAAFGAKTHIDSLGIGQGQLMSADIHVVAKQTACGGLKRPATSSDWRGVAGSLERAGAITKAVQTTVEALFCQSLRGHGRP